MRFCLVMWLAGYGGIAREGVALLQGSWLLRYAVEWNEVSFMLIRIRVKIV